MDAVKYLKTLQRMCRCSSNCMACPLFKILGRGCGLFSANSEGLVDTTEIVEQWAKDHPARTRQSVFLKRYPDASVNADGALEICPQLIIKNYECYGECQKCKKHYWSQETDK